MNLAMFNMSDESVFLILWGIFCVIFIGMILFYKIVNIVSIVVCLLLGVLLA